MMHFREGPMRALLIFAVVLSVAPVHAQTSTTNRFKNGSATVCETRASRVAHRPAQGAGRRAPARPARRKSIRTESGKCLEPVQRPCFCGCGTVRCNSTPPTNRSCVCQEGTGVAWKDNSGCLTRRHWLRLCAFDGGAPARETIEGRGMRSATAPPMLAALVRSQSRQRGSCRQ